MSIESDSQGELFQYFLIEAPELLQTIEETLLSSIEEKTVDKVHTLMRSAHTLKGSAASVEQPTISTIAHHLEDVFEALYPEELEIDPELGGLLLEGYDCLREPLSATIAGLDYDREAILEQTAAVFAQLQDKLGDFFGREATLPTSSELGFDVVGSIFSESVIQDLELLEETIVAQNPQEIEELLISQMGFFSDLGFTYDLPGLAQIAQTTLAAIERHPTEITEIAIAALTNFHQARAEILEGDRIKGGEVSSELKGFVGEDFAISETVIEPEPTIDFPAEDFDDSFFDDSDAENSEMTMIFSTEAIANSAVNSFETTEIAVEPDSAIDFSEDILGEEIFDDSFFSEEIDDDAEMTMAFSSEIIAYAQDADLKANLEADSIEEPKIIEEVATLESEIDSVRFDANYQVSAKSPVEEILQSIATLKVPLVNSEETLPSEEQNKTADKSSNIVLPTIKVAIEQLDRLNHTVGELFIKENQQNLQQDRLQLLLKETLTEFRHCQSELSHLGDWSERQKRDRKRQHRKHRHHLQIDGRKTVAPLTAIANRQKTLPKQNLLADNLNSLTDFDALEMDVYSDLDLKLQVICESMTKLGNRINNIERIVQQSTKEIARRKQLLNIAQSELLQARMLPLSKVFNRFPRHVQQMVSSYQKPAKFKTIGGEVTIDKAIAEKLYEPLLHLIRNAYDHGLESPEVRQQKHKSNVGKITIRAYNRGNRTIIEIQDDGKGINLEKVLTKAIEKNLVEPSQIEALSETEITNFLFEPGFSTASQVTDLSGRGVGLNVVKSQLKALDGTISIRSIADLGTTFTLQLPLNITTSKLLLCEDRGIIYGILATEIKRVIDPKFEEIKQQPSLNGDGRESFLCYQQADRQELIPIRSLENTIDYTLPIIPRESSLLNTLIGQKEKIQNRALLLIEAESKQLCLQVERVLTEQELVIKSLNSIAVIPSYIQGYSVLGDGSLSLVINPIDLVAQTYHRSTTKSNETIISALDFSQSKPTEMTITTNKKSLTYYKLTILVIEDSIVQRQSIVRILAQENYDILQAGNGQEAIAIMEKTSQIDLILSDVEMPVMNGFEFLIYCQSNFQFARIPVAMITTRSGQKHRQLALSLGAKYYMTKPAGERELLNLVDELIST